VAWAKDGHDAAFRELVRRYERPVFSLLYRMVRDRALAEDLAQETFIKVLNGIKSYRPEFKFSSWIFKIANNAAIDHLRRKSIDTLSLDGAPGAETPDQVRATSLQLGARHRDRTRHCPTPAGVPVLHPTAARGRVFLR
jgi:RNA polymerase sigma-70 factor (ECF subfamily)